MTTAWHSPFTAIDVPRSVTARFGYRLYEHEEYHRNLVWNSGRCVQQERGECVRPRGGGGHRPEHFCRTCSMARTHLALDGSRAIGMGSSGQSRPVGVGRRRATALGSSGQSSRGDGLQSSNGPEQQGPIPSGGDASSLCGASSEMGTCADEAALDPESDSESIESTRSDSAVKACS